VTEEGIATSGTYERGDHIYNPQGRQIPKLVRNDSEVVSVTVIAKNIYDADRFATAAFAMGRNGIYFLEAKKGLEAYMIDKQGIATSTNGFSKYVTVLSS
jgi:thiamine biosynthesis lipoprotein